MCRVHAFFQILQYKPLNSITVCVFILYLMLAQRHTGEVNLLHPVVIQPANRDFHLSGTHKIALQCAPLGAPSLENAQCPLLNVHGEKNTS